MSSPQKKTHTIGVLASLEACEPPCQYRASWRAFVVPGWGAAAGSGAHQLVEHVVAVGALIPELGRREVEEVRRPVQLVVVPFRVVERQVVSHVRGRGRRP